MMTRLDDLKRLLHHLEQAEMLIKKHERFFNHHCSIMIDKDTLETFVGEVSILIRDKAKDQNQIISDYDEIQMILSRLTDLINLHRLGSNDD